MGTITNLPSPRPTFRVPGVGDTELDRWERQVDRLRLVVTLLRFAYNRSADDDLRVALKASSAELIRLERLITTREAAA